MTEVVHQEMSKVKMAGESLPSGVGMWWHQEHWAELDSSEKPGNRASVQAQPRQCCVVLNKKVVSLCSTSFSNVVGWGHHFTHLKVGFKGSGFNQGRQGSTLRKGMLD